MKAWPKNRVNDSDPVIRLVYALRGETYVGPKGPPGGGFFVPKIKTYIKLALS